jgi:aminomethyltransferase
MSATAILVGGVNCFVSRSGYTGEDGFEISLPAAEVETVARLLLAEPETTPVGLGARDTLRLEAGLCLYGHDIDETTTPVEAGLTWSIAKRRRAKGGYPGAEVIARQLAEGVARKRVGIRPEGRQPVREHTEVRDAEGGPIAMGYVAAPQASPGTALGLVIRGKSLPGRVARLPFVPQRYYRG